MFSFGASADKEQFFVIFDIDSASVGASVAVRAKDVTKILWQTRILFGYRSDADFERYVKTMYATLLEIAMRTSSEGIKNVKSLYPQFKIHDAGVHCVIGAPWYFGAVETVEKKAEKPFLVTSEIIDTMLDKGASIIMEPQDNFTSFTSFTSWQDVMGQSAVLEARPDKVTIEGYPIQNFEKREAQHLSVHVYYSFMSVSVKNHLEEIVQKVFANHTIHFSTATHLFAHSECTEKKKMVLLEMSEEVTTVSVVKQGVLQGTVMFPSGLNHILRSVVPKADNAHDAQKLLGVLIPKTDAHGLDFDMLAEPLQDALNSWQQSFFEALGAIVKGVTPPLSIAVIVDEFWYPIFKSALSTPTSMPGIRAEYNPHVVHIHESVEKNALKEGKIDYRLSTVVMLYEGYTHKKGVWYTKK